MSDEKAIDWVGINDKGRRIGQDHPNAVLTDVEVEALICDRGPDDSTVMSYSQLAGKYGISKSSVRDILIGRRRGQAAKYVKKDASEKMSHKKVDIRLRVTLRARALIHQMGGAKLIEKMLFKIESELRRAPTNDANLVISRVLRNMSAAK